MKKLSDRTRMGLIFLLASAGVNIVLGFIFALVFYATGDKPFLHCLDYGMSAMLVLAAGGGYAAGILAFTTTIHSDCLWGYGAYFFYGTAIVGTWISKIFIAEYKNFSYVIVFIILALAGYIFWEKELKSKYEEIEKYERKE